MNSIREARIRMGLSQKELARNAGIDARTLRKIENGDHVSEVSLHAAERALGVATREDGVQRKIERKALVAPKVFCICAFVFYVLLIALAWYIHRELQSDGWQVVAALGVVCAVVAAPIYIFAVDAGPDRGNTCIWFKAPLTSANDVDNPLEMAKRFLGRDDVMVGDVEFDGASFRFVAFADYEFREYPSLIAKLKNLGVDATVSSAV